MVIFDRSRKAEILRDVAYHRLIFIAPEFELFEMLSEDHNTTGRCAFAVTGGGSYAKAASIAVPLNWPYLPMINKELANNVLFCAHTRFAHPYATPHFVRPLPPVIT